MKNMQARNRRRFHFLTQWTAQFAVVRRSSGALLLAFLCSMLLLACGGNRTKAAEQLGMSRRSLYNKLKRYGLANA